MVITAAVYGAVALIVKMDNIGLVWRNGSPRATIGRGLVVGMPELLSVACAHRHRRDAVGRWPHPPRRRRRARRHWPDDFVHEVEHGSRMCRASGGVLAGSSTRRSAAVGLAVGTIVVAAISKRANASEAKSPRVLTEYGRA